MFSGSLDFVLSQQVCPCLLPGSNDLFHQAQLLLSPSLLPLHLLLLSALLSPVLFNYSPFFSRELPTQLLKTCYFGTPNPCELTARTDARALESIFPPDHYYKNDYKRLKPRISLLASGMNPGDGFFGGKISSYCKAHAKFQGWETSRNTLSCGLQ